MFEGFELSFVDVGEATIRCATVAVVRGRSLDCGHFLAEEAPEETYAELRTFFGG